MRRFIIASVLFFCATTLLAQEFDVFDFNDFVDPRLHGAVFGPDGKLVETGDTFRIIRAATGGFSDYAWRSTPTHDDVGFLHFVGSQYRGNLQTNVKLTMLDGQQDTSLPRYRVMTQLARYTMHEANTKVKESGTERVSGRVMVSLAVEDNRLDDPTRRTRRFNTEIGVEIDVAGNIYGGRNASGSFVWTSRNTAVPEATTCTASCSVQPPRTQRTQRATYYYRFEDHTFGDRYHVGASFGFGGEKTDRWRWGATRLGLHATADIGGAGTINFTWTPTFVPRDPNHKNSTQEIGLFIDRTMFASLHR